MSSNETHAGCERVLTAMTGEPASLDEGAIRRRLYCIATSRAFFPVFDDMRAA